MMSKRIKYKKPLSQIKERGYLNIHYTVVYLQTANAIIHPAFLSPKRFKLAGIGTFLPRFRRASPSTSLDRKSNVCSCRKKLANQDQTR